MPARRGAVPRRPRVRDGRGKSRRLAEQYAGHLSPGRLTPGATRRLAEIAVKSLPHRTVRGCSRVERESGGGATVHANLPVKSRKTSMFRNGNGGVAGRHNETCPALFGISEIATQACPRQAQSRSKVGHLWGLHFSLGNSAVSPTAEIAPVPFWPVNNANRGFTQLHE